VITYDWLLTCECLRSSCLVRPRHDKTPECGVEARTYYVYRGIQISCTIGFSSGDSNEKVRVKDILGSSFDIERDFTPVLV